jgi:hypothetical protein
MDIDSEIFANAEIPPEELARMDAEEAAAKEKAARENAGTAKRIGRPRKNEAPAPAEPKKKGRPRLKKE